MLISPRGFIEEIRNKIISSDRFVLDSLSGAIDRLQKAFPRYGSFLMEFVQNADDAKSESLKIEIQQDTIRISNNGHPFYKDDVESICKVGRTSKTAIEYIGYLGVGFKAVFLISETPQIYSGSYRFKFDRNFWSNSDQIPWQIIPVWIEKPSINLSDYSTKYNTVFELPLKEVPILLVKLSEEVTTEHLNNRILLFLRNIKEIEIVNHVANLKREIRISEILKKHNYEIYQIQEYENANLKNQDIWLIFRSICRVPSDVKDDHITKDWERDNIDKREVLVAFRLDDQKNLEEEERGTAHIGVYSFLPLKEIPSGLKFLLQADFLTAPGRGELARECLWNEWLADELYNLIIEKCIATFLNHKQWKMNFTNILYSSDGGHELFEEHIKKPLNTYLRDNAVLVAEDGSISKAEEVISIGKDIRKLFTDQDLKTLYPDEKIIHKECDPDPSLKIKKAPTDIIKFIKSSKGEKIIQLKAKKKDVNWFNRFYSLLVDKYDIIYFGKQDYHYNVKHDKFWNELRNLDSCIILTKNYEVAKINECYTNPKKLQIPVSLKEKIKIVHPQIVKDENFNDLQRKLNEERYHYNPPDIKVLRELTKDDIRYALKMLETHEMNEEKWHKLSESKKMEKIDEIKELWKKNLITLEDYTYITLKSKDGVWYKPKKLVLSEEYNPEHNIETLINKELFDKPLKFVSTEFIQNLTSEDALRKWRKFFEELGVDTIIDTQKKSIVQRIGIKTAFQYEEKNFRSEHKELGESEKLGYDIVSRSENEERYIEVKSTYKSSYDIFLTVNEYRVLREKKEKYFIYVIINAFRDPVLFVTHGDKLYEIKDVKTIIPFTLWKDIIEDEFQP